MVKSKNHTIIVNSMLKLTLVANSNIEYYSLRLEAGTRYRGSIYLYRTFNPNCLYFE